MRRGPEGDVGSRCVRVGIDKEAQQGTRARTPQWSPVSESGGAKKAASFVFFLAELLGVPGLETQS